MVVAPDDAEGNEIQFQDIGWSGTRFRFTGEQALLLCFITGCAVTGPADDGFENSLESVDIGTLQDGDLLSNLARKAANLQTNALD